MTTDIDELRKLNSTKLKNKVALVTGGSRGIGAAIALRLAAEGASVALTYANNSVAAEQVCATISELGTKAACFKADVASEEDNKKLFSEVIKTFGKIDILVNNAGVYESKPVAEIDLQHYQHVFDINVKGAIITTVAALKHIPDGGRIINISSGAAKNTFTTASVYSASKAALETLTRVWAQDLGPRQINVNAVAPGTTATDMLEAGLSKEVKEMLVMKTALKRLGEPDDIANVVAFLASPDGSWITGITINCDGGLIL